MKRGIIFTVHFGDNKETTCNFADAILPFLNSSLNLVIINNSVDVDLKSLNNDNISVIESDINLGYLGGFKFGMENTSLNDIDYVILCNNDIKILNDDFFSIVDGKLHCYEIIAPSIKTLDNIEQNPHRSGYISFARRIFDFIFYSNYHLAKVLTELIYLKKKFTKTVSKNEHEREIFSPHGAFMIFNMQYFKKGGYLDTGSFLYGEEDSITAIALENNFKIGYIPSLKILHMESTTIGKGIPKAKYFHLKNANHYIKNKYPILYS